MAELLAVVADEDLRRSLDFVIKAEGHSVAWRVKIDGHPILSRFACTLLDDGCVGQNLAQGRNFCRAFDPVILLTIDDNHPLAGSAFRTVIKPLLGPNLVDAIEVSIRVRGV